jgi:putative N6-adenine-specific DNA methylase
VSGSAVPAANEKALARRIKDHVIGSSHEFFAVVHPGFEETARRELAGLGIAADVAGPGGVAFAGRLEDAWRANLGSGTVSRVLMRLARFKATGFAEFRDRVAAVPWELHLGDGAALAFTVSAARSRLWHEGRLQEEAAQAVTQRLAGFGRSARVGKDGGGAGQHVFIRMEENRCQVSLDSSGELLYRRGRGKFTEGAPLRETLACAILRAAGCERYRTLVDPFCGSGTFALEAGAIFLGRPAGNDRSFAFQGWPSFRPARFAHVRDELARMMREKAPAGPQRIYGSDLDEKAAATARRNVAAAGLAGMVEVDQADFFRLHPPAGPPATVLLAMNPPYGARQLPAADIAALFRRIGDKVRRDYAGCGYAIIVPGLENEKALGLPHDEKILFHNGGIPVALLIKDSVTRNASR